MKKIAPVTQLSQDMGAKYAVFGFSHDWEVVAAVSAAGGVGILGTNRYDAQELERDLKRITDAIGDKPFGVNLLMPSSKVREHFSDIPEGHTKFVEGLSETLGLEASGPWTKDHTFGGDIMTREHALELLDVSLEFKPSMVSFGLGFPPEEAITKIRDLGAVLAGLAGAPKHARALTDKGFDCIVAQGYDAAGHTGTIATSVLAAQLAHDFPTTPILYAGGVSTGAQIAAAHALGTQGVWVGTSLLTTRESAVPEELKQRLLEAGPEDTYRVRFVSGKPSRQIRNAILDAWGEPGSPEPLDAPLQGKLVAPVVISGLQSGRSELMISPAGQGVGLLKESETVQQLIDRWVSEFEASVSQLVANSELGDTSA